MATSSVSEVEDVGTYDDVLGKAISDFDAKDTCEISVKKGTVAHFHTIIIK